MIHALRLEARDKVSNKYDPIFVLLERVIFSKLFCPVKSSGGIERLDAAEVEFLLENLQKHRIIIWLNIVLVVYLFFSGVEKILGTGDYSVVVAGLLAPAMITGTAWFTVSFGGIPEKFIGIAFVLTFWMFTAFSLSMTLLTVLLISITPWELGVFVLTPIYIGLYLASLLYDNVDGLKIGLDSTLLKFSRASLNYYRKHGWIDAEETQSEVYSDEDSDEQISSKIASFTHYLNLLKSNLRQLEDEKPIQVANHLIASSTDLIFRVIELPIGNELDKGDKDNYEEYVINASNKEQPEVDKATIDFLHIALGNLTTVFMGNSSALDDIERIKVMLDQFEVIRDDDSTSDAATSSSNLKEEGRHEIGQTIADYLFAQVFSQILSLMESHRYSFLAQKRN